MDPLPPPPPVFGLGALPAPPPPPVGAPAPRWHAALGIAVVGTLVAGVATVATRLDRGPSHPDRWDPRVVDLAAFVEEERGLRFDHPVHIDFLTAEEYSQEATTDAAGVDDEQRAELERFAAELRAFGLATGELDLVEAYNAVTDAGTLAFYDPDDERIRVRGTEMTVGLEVTLVHELAHALQDQHFDLDRLYDDDRDSSGYTAFLGLVEGDALRIETAYTTTELAPDERDAYEEEYAGELERSEAATSDVPDYVSASFAVPYALGQPFVVMLANEGGNDAIDDAFRDPPTTEEHLFDPASFLADESGHEVDLELGDVDVLDDGPFGAPSWYLVLAERIDPKVAFRAALGWAGDQYASFERDGRACVRAGFAGDTAEDEAEMASALRGWVAAMPAGAARVLELGGRPAIESCDPGVDVEDPNLTGRSSDALFVPSLWGYLVADVSSALDPHQARCYAGHVLEELTFEEISDPEGAVFADDDFQETLRQAYDACT